LSFCGYIQWLDGFARSTQHGLQQHGYMPGFIAAVNGPLQDLLG
jgi:hypothetical protein